MIERPLRGWKEIGAFLGTSPRSAQRWERDLALPVHRLRTTTGSVVSAYPSELDAWRNRVGADLRDDQAERILDNDPDVGDGRDTSDEIAMSTPTSAAPASPPARRPFPVAWWLAVAAALVVVAAAGTLLRSGQHAPASRPAESGREPVAGARPAGAGAEHREQGLAAGATTAVTLRFTRDRVTVRLRVQKGELATMVLPGVPVLRVRAIRAGSELTVELFRQAGTAPAASGLPRVAALRLARRAPALVTFAGTAPIAIAWE